MRKALCFVVLGFFAGCSESFTSSGVVRDRTGTAQPGIVVRLFSLNDSGTVQAEIEQRVTDSNGKFAVDIPADPSANLVLSAELPSGALRAFAAGEFERDAQGFSLTKANIDAYTEALVTAVLYVTETNGGRTLTDFTADELRPLMRDVRAALVADTSLDLSNASAVVTALISNSGRQIAGVAGGAITAVPFDSVSAANTTRSVAAGEFVDMSPPNSCPDEAFFIIGKFLVFDFLKSGSLCSVDSSDAVVIAAFDTGSELSIKGGELFSGLDFFPGDPDRNPVAPNPVVTEEDGRELVFVPAASAANGNNEGLTDSQNLRVTRKVYVVPNEDVVRFLEMVENVSGASISLDVEVVGRIGEPTFRDILFAQNSQTTFDETSDFGAFFNTKPNNTKPEVGFVIDGPAAPDGVDAAQFPRVISAPYSYRWNDISIPAGGRAVYLHYFYGALTQDEAIFRTKLESIYNSPDMTGLSADELNNLRNFLPAIGNVSGEAGSVSSNATVTVTNAASTSVNVPAGRDGSFKAMIAGVSGDSIQVTATDGTDTTVTIP